MAIDQTTKLSDALKSYRENEIVHILQNFQDGIASGDIKAVTIKDSRFKVSYLDERGKPQEKEIDDELILVNTEQQTWFDAQALSSRSTISRNTGQFALELEEAEENEDLFEQLVALRQNHLKEKNKEAGKSSKAGKDASIRMTTKRSTASTSTPASSDADSAPEEPIVTSEFAGPQAASEPKSNPQPIRTTVHLPDLTEELDITQAEKNFLHDLYADGGWTTTEVHNYLGQERTEEFVDAGVIHETASGMGDLYLLTAVGIKSCFGVVGNPRSTNSQIDRAYLRLCAQDYGWEEVPLEENSELVQYDKSRRGVQYQTPQGMVLAFGNLTRPITSVGIRNLVQKYQAVALRYRFRVVVFTPLETRGQERASRHSNILELIHHVPNQRAKPNRHHIITGEEDKSKSPDRATNDYEAETLRAAGILEETLRTYNLRLKDRIEKARHDLQVDQVISHGQLARYYRLEPGDLVGTHYTYDLLQPVHSKRSLEIPVVFFCSSKKVADHHPTLLAHRAGTKELRHLLQAPADPEVWHLEQRHKHRSEEPDAYWKNDDGLSAIEFDTGSYSATTVQFKIEKFRERGATQIIWGVPTQKRQSNLQKKFGIEVELCQWWHEE